MHLKRSRPVGGIGSTRDSKGKDRRGSKGKDSEEEYIEHDGQQVEKQGASSKDGGGRKVEEYVYKGKKADGQKWEMKEEHEEKSTHLESEDEKDEQMKFLLDTR